MPECAVAYVVQQVSKPNLSSRCSPRMARRSPKADFVPPNRRKVTAHKSLEKFSGFQYDTFTLECRLYPNTSAMPAIFPLAMNLNWGKILGNVQSFQRVSQVCLLSTRSNSGLLAQWFHAPLPNRTKDSRSRISGYNMPRVRYIMHAMSGRGCLSACGIHCRPCRCISGCSDKLSTASQPPAQRVKCLHYHLEKPMLPSILSQTLSHSRPGHGL